jgi:Phage tail tube protein
MTIAAAISPVIYGTLVGLESPYGTAATLTASDYVMPVEKPKLTIAWVGDGKRSVDARSAGNLALTRKSGMILSSEIKLYARADLTTYSATEFPRDIHRFLRACDLADTYSAATHTYAPSFGNTSLTIDSYVSALKYRATGVLCSGFKMDASAGGLIEFTFPWKGIGTIPVDATLPDVSAYNVADPLMKFDGANTGILIGGVALAVRKIAMEQAGVLTDRPVGTIAGAYQGVTRGRRTVKITISVEAQPLSVLDPYTLMKNGTLISLCLPFGDTGAGLGYKLNSTTTAQIESVGEVEDGGLAVWDLGLELTGGSTGNLEYNLAFI